MKEQEEEVKEAMSLQALEKALFSGEFVDMVAMKALHALEERMKDQPDCIKLINSVYMLLLFRSYVQENPEGMVMWFNNQMAAEAVGEISQLTRWEVE